MARTKTLPKTLPFNLLPYSFSTLEAAKGFQRELQREFGWESARAAPDENGVVLVAVFQPVQPAKKRRTTVKTAKRRK